MQMQLLNTTPKLSCQEKFLDKIFNPIKYKRLKERGGYEGRNKNNEIKRNDAGQHNNNRGDFEGAGRGLLDGRGCLKRAYGEFLKELGERINFCWYATLTFREPVHPESAHKRFMRWIHKLNRKIYGVRYTKRKQGVRWVRALEWQKRDVIHFHCLIADIPEEWNPEFKDLRRLHWMDEWYKVNGIARIYPYDKNLGACFYLGKYISKGGEIDYSDNIAVAKQQLLLL